MDYSLVKVALRDAVKTAEIPKLTCYSYLPDNPELPCFAATEVQIRPNNAHGGLSNPGGYDDATITCVIFVSTADDADAQRALDRLISRSGPYSVREAIYVHGRGAPGVAALGGLCDDVWVTAIDGYGVIALGDDRNYYGVTIQVRLIGTGD